MFTHLMAAAPGVSLSPESIDAMQEHASAALDSLEQLPSLDASALAEAFRQFPTIGLIPSGVALLVGFLLWWHGERFLRLGLMLLGIVVGVPVGLGVFAALAPSLPPLAAAIAGAVVLMALAAIGMRFAVAGGLAFMVGLAALLATVVAVERGLIAPDAPSLGVRSNEQPSVRLATLHPRWADDADDEGAEVEEPASPLSHLTSSLLQVRTWTQERWDALPQPGRTLAGGAGLAGAVIGFGVGLIFRRAALRVVTALLGSMLILAGGTALVGVLFPDWVAETLPGGPWLALWASLTVFGGVLQGKRAKKAAKSEE